LATQREIEQWLQEGIVAAKAGQREQARFRLLDVVEQNQTNETAWYWLYQLFDYSEDKRVCLENLITINPNNEWAQRELDKLPPSSASPGARPARKRPTSWQASVTGSHRLIILRLMIAFWLGISITLLGGGILTFVDWLSASIRTRTFPNYITVLQVFNLLVAMGLFTAGLASLIVATLLFFRSMVGFYGSILLALGLLLVGPLVSLIVDPPNYLTLICTGGISGMIVLLTLAGQAGFGDTP
jgi:hypothetical protein